MIDVTNDDCEMRLLVTGMSSSSCEPHVEVMKTGKTGLDSLFLCARTDCRVQPAFSLQGDGNTLPGEVKWSDHETY
jgi:hypothetical protein